MYRTVDHTRSPTDRSMSGSLCKKSVKRPTFGDRSEKGLFKEERVPRVLKGSVRSFKPGKTSYVSYQSVTKHVLSFQKKGRTGSTRSYTDFFMGTVFPLILHELHPLHRQIPPFQCSVIHIYLPYDLTPLFLSLLY